MRHSSIWFFLTMPLLFPCLNELLAHTSRGTDQIVLIISLPPSLAQMATRARLRHICMSIPC